TTLERKELLAGLRIPHVYLLTSAGQAFAIRAEGHAPAIVLEGEKLPASLRIPHFHFPSDLGFLGAIPGAASGAGQAFAVRAVGHAANCGGVPLQGEDRLVAEPIQI